MTKVNPKRVPRSQADVDKAWDEGVAKGIERAIYMTLWVLIDRHNATHDEIKQFEAEYMDLADSINRGYVSWYDIRKALVEEYDVELRLK